MFTVRLEVPAGPVPVERGLNCAGAGAGSSAGAAFIGFPWGLAGTRGTVKVHVEGSWRGEKAHRGGKLERGDILPGSWSSSTFRGVHAPQIV